MYRSTPKELFEIKNLPKPNKDSVLSKLSISLDEIFEDVFIKNVYLPPNTKIEIESDQIIKMYNDVFGFTIQNTELTYKQGLSGKIPQIGRFIGRASDGYQDVFKEYSTMDLKYFYDANLKFPGQNLEYFDSYIRFMHTVRHIIDKDWNHNKLVEQLSKPMLYNIEERLRRIENLLRANSKD